ncbi:unnamed protein product [Thelazia callipaeda]|uniref:LRRCT domain-containing protein n=1 Tax=Thelazia callipaeda TaxID=103827 RepID=A0A0N5D2M3_THECL|nr:unnamed protein product [Thelazia callipaeda]
MVICLSRQLILQTILAYCITAFCPVHHSCICESQPDGYYLECDGSTETNLSDIIQSLNERYVQRLTVTNASWPLIEELPAAHIRSLQLISCGIKNIKNTSFAKLADDLEHLAITWNFLTTVPVLGYLSKLISLNLNHNQLTELPDNVLKGAENLRHLRLEGNKICSLSSNAMLEIKNMLELLDLSDNCIENIPAQNLRNCMQLTYLDLSHNAVNKIANFELMNLPLLKELRLNNNQISYISPMAFMNVPLLEHLYIQNNRISSIETERLFQVFKNLEVLDLSSNMFTKIPSFKELSKLRQIHLSYNRITQIETLAFSSNTKLQLISLQNNHILSLSRNSFDSLDELVVLNLANNFISKIERGMFDGMQNLQQLNLRNNSITVLDNMTFTSVSQITTLDLAHNGIQKIEKDAFRTLKYLFWLDLSSNNIRTLEMGTFNEKIANILLNDNPLYCDKKMDWLVSYLVTNQVRTFLPTQNEVLCSGPDKYKGRDKLNSVISSGVYGLLPIVTPTQKPNSLEMVPIIGAFTDVIPSIQNFPGINYLPKAKGEQMHDVQKLNSAIEQLSAPLIRVATGERAGPADIEQIIQAIPNLVINVPGIGNVDLSKLPPGVIAHVLRGGKIPGLPAEVLDRITKEYLRRMHAAAEAAKQGKLRNTESRYLPPLETLPQDLVTQVMQGGELPHLDQEQTQSIRDYYTSKLLTSNNLNELKNVSKEKSKSLTSRMSKVVKMLPPGYNISKVPKAVIDTVLRGEIPDFTILPSELQQYFLTNGHQFISALFTEKNKTIEEILHNLPTFERPIKPTFVPYDINEVSNDLAHVEQRTEKLIKIQYYTALLLGFVGAASVAVLGLICIYMKQKRFANMDGDIDEDSLVNPSQVPQLQHSPTNRMKINSSFTKERNLSDISHTFKI